LQKSDIANISKTTTTAGTNITKLAEWSSYFGYGLKLLRIQFQVTDSISNGATILTLPNELQPSGGYCSSVAVETNGATMLPVFITGTSVKACASVSSGYYVLTATYY